MRDGIVRWNWRTVGIVRIKIAAARVEFDTPVPPGSTEAPAGITVLRDQQVCVRYDDAAVASGEADLEITSASGTTTASGTLSGLTVTCPDGSSYFTESPLSVATGCGSLGGFPGVTTTRTTTNRLGFALALGEEPGGRDIEVVLFDCEWP